MKKLFIFDMGGVAAGNVDVMPDVLNRLGMTRQDFIGYAGNGLEDLSNGRIGSECFWKDFSMRAGIPMPDDLFTVFFKPELIPGTVELIGELKRKYRVVCGTNTYDCHYEIHERRKDYAIFHTIYASNLMGVSKPDSRFYTRILSDETVSPGDAVFIDDREENILGAEAAGIDAFIFTSPERLREDLVKKGIMYRTA